MTDFMKVRAQTLTSKLWISCSSKPSPFSSITDFQGCPDYRALTVIVYGDKKRSVKQENG